MRIRKPGGPESGRYISFDGLSWQAASAAAVCVSNSAWNPYLPADGWTSVSYQQVQQARQIAATPSRFTAVAPGTYHVTAWMEGSVTPASSFSDIQIRKNGNPVQGSTHAGSPATNNLNAYTVLNSDVIVDLAAGDYVEAWLHLSANETITTTPSRMLFTIQSV